MATTSRVFLLDEDGSIRPIPLARFERLWECDPNERLPECAGKRVRCVVVILEVQQRRPVEILHLDWSWLPFDSSGSLEETQLEIQRRVAIDMIDLVTATDKSAAVLQGRSHFAKKRYQHEFNWAPTPEVEEAVRRAVFGCHPR
jgi:hypothetical protein